MDLNEKRSDEAAGKTDGKYLLNTVRADKYEVDGRRKSSKGEIFAISEAMKIPYLLMR